MPSTFHTCISTSAVYVRFSNGFKNYWMNVDLWNVALSPANQTINKVKQLELSKTTLWMFVKGPKQLKPQCPFSSKIFQNIRSDQTETHTQTPRNPQNRKIQSNDLDIPERSSLPEILPPATYCSNAKSILIATWLITPCDHHTRSQNDTYSRVTQLSWHPYEFVFLRIVFLVCRPPEKPSCFPPSSSSPKKSLDKSTQTRITRVPPNPLPVPTQDEVPGNPRSPPLSVNALTIAIRKEFRFQTLCHDPAVPPFRAETMIVSQSIVSKCNLIHDGWYIFLFIMDDWYNTNVPWLCWSWCFAKLHVLKRDRHTKDNHTIIHTSNHHDHVLIRKLQQ